METVLSCSWRHPLPPFVFVNSEHDARMCAERAASTCGKDISVTRVEFVDETGVAPWVMVRLQQRVDYIAVVSSARIIEVHVGDASVLTYEGTGTAADVFVHCIGCDVLAEQTLKLKFFARRVKKAIDIAVICLSTGNNTEEPVDADCRHRVTKNADPTFEDRLQHFESVIQLLMGTVMRRLGDMEARLCALERR